MYSVREQRPPDVTVAEWDVEGAALMRATMLGALDYYFDKRSAAERAAKPFASVRLMMPAALLPPSTRLQERETNQARRPARITAATSVSRATATSVRSTKRTSLGTATVRVAHVAARPALRPGQGCTGVAEGPQEARAPARALRRAQARHVPEGRCLEAAGEVREPGRRAEQQRVPHKPSPAPAPAGTCAGRREW